MFGYKKFYAFGTSGDIEEDLLARVGKKARTYFEWCLEMGGKSDIGLIGHSWEGSRPQKLNGIGITRGEIL